MVILNINIFRQSRHDNIGMASQTASDKMNMAQINALTAANNMGSMNVPAAAAAAMQAFQQQLFRGKVLIIFTYYFFLF